MSSNVHIRSSHFGRGVFAARDITEDDVILTFSGPIITFEQAVALGVNEANALQIDATYYMDLEEPGRYVNHSCAPNAGIKQHTRLIALRRIARDEEIHYDYSTTMLEDHWTMICKCGASGCRGIVSDFRSLSARLQRRYLRLGI